jgi:hypothetical protein
VHACLGTAIARLSVKIAFDEFHRVVPDYRRVPMSRCSWMPSSTFRSPTRLGCPCNEFREVPWHASPTSNPPGQPVSVERGRRLEPDAGRHRRRRRRHRRRVRRVLRLRHLPLLRRPRARMAELPPPSRPNSRCWTTWPPNAGPNSRLACQIKASPALEGLIVTLPESQE